jgi:hypothetical protein
MNANDGPLEVWLRQDDEEIICTVVRDDESTYELDVDSLSMRGAQREMTGYFIAHSYEPADQWQVEVDGDRGPVETVRRFTPARLPGPAWGGDAAGDALDALDVADDLLP